MVRAFWPLPLGCQRSAGSVLNSVHLTPWKSRNSASTSPTGPPPTIATWVVGSAIDCLLTFGRHGRSLGCLAKYGRRPRAHLRAGRFLLRVGQGLGGRRRAGRGAQWSPARRLRRARAAVTSGKISARRHAHEPLEHGGEGGRAVVAEVEG